MKPCQVTYSTQAATGGYAGGISARWKPRGHRYRH